MAKIYIACPLCRGVFPFAGAPPLGTSIHCGKCGAPFSVCPNDLRPDVESLPSARAESPSVAAAVAAASKAERKAQTQAQPGAGAPASTSSSTLVRAAQATMNLPPSQQTPREMPKTNPVVRPQEPQADVGRYLILGGVTIGMLLIAGLGSVVAVNYLKPKSDDGSLAQSSDGESRLHGLNPASGAHEEARQKKLRDVILQSEPQQGPGQPESPAPLPPEKRADALPDVPAEAKEAAAKPIPPAPDPGRDIPPPPPAVKRPVIVSPQQRIDEAIANGLKFLLAEQTKSGGWPTNAYSLGNAALPGLTLLECGISPNDPHVQRAADFVRKNAKDHTGTYEISLAILFLDRLGQKSDGPLIRSLGLRLLAGQNDMGGWTYTCHTLTESQAQQLLTSRKKSEPKAPPIAVDKSKNSMPTSSQKNEKSSLPTQSDKSDKLQLPAPRDKSGQSVPPDSGGGRGPGESSILPNQPPIKGPGGQPPGLPGKGGKDMKWGDMVKNKAFMDDNSNTQFAMLGLWAARRHGLPVAKAMSLVDQRFRASQLGSGAWSYRFHDDRDRASMTCVGLLALALAKGATYDSTAKAAGQANAAPGNGPRSVVQDGAMRQGFEYLSNYLQPQQPDGYDLPRGITLYLLWSVERVGVLYNLQKIGEHDWYHWGAEMLLATQQKNGGWDMGDSRWRVDRAGFNPNIDTSFALLFLKRVNLVQDLTDNLLNMQVISDSKGPMPK
jgi:hypothetical protein